VRKKRGLEEKRGTYSQIEGDFAETRRNITPPHFPPEIMKEGSSPLYPRRKLHLSSGEGERLFFTLRGFLSYFQKSPEKKRNKRFVENPKKEPIICRNFPSLLSEKQGEKGGGRIGAA